MNRGDIIELTITGTGMDGEGVAKLDGMVIFVPYTLVGEKVKCKVTFVKKSFATASVIKVLVASPNRINPICPQFFKCGGCGLMHVKESEADAIKVENLVNCLRKIAKIEPEIDSLVKAGSSYGYRNKVQLPIGIVNNTLVVGYYKEKSHELVPFDKCYLQAEWADEVVEIFLDYAFDRRLSIYDERTGEGLLRHLVLRKLGDVVSIVIVINGEELPNSQDLIDSLKRANIKFNLHININIEMTNVIVSDSYKLLYGKECLNATINDVDLEIAPNSFMQVNTEVASVIYNDIRSNLKTHGNSVILEGYSGVGVLSNMLASSCIGVISVEIVASAVANAREIARKNHNDNKIVTLCGDAGQLMPMIAESIRSGKIEWLEDTGLLMESEEKLVREWLDKHPQVIAVVDPPRKGCDETVINAMIDAKPSYIYYISCNPSTLARDIQILSSDYSVIKVTPYDMFPQTSNLETLVILERLVK